MMWRQHGALLVAFALLAALSLPALADQTATVTATVTPNVVKSVSLDVTSVAYGTLNTSASDNNRTTALSSVITATNNGNTIEDLYIRGTDATAAVQNDSNWTLHCDPLDSDIDGTVGLNQYVHRFYVGTTFTHADARTICTISDQKKIANDIAVLGTVSFILQLNMPTATTGFSQRTMTVTVMATDP
jgi:hypothetical protein